MTIPDSIIQWGEVFAAIGVIVGAVKYVFLPIRRFFKGVKGHFSKIETIHRELTPNGGGSIKDAVTGLRKTVGQMEKRQRCWLTIHNQPVFETDAAGNLTWANREYMGLLGATWEEVEGRGWRNYLVADSTFTAWESAVADKRDFKACFSFRDDAGREVPVCVEALAMRDEKGALQGYVGNITRR